MARPRNGTNLNIAQLEQILDQRRSEIQKLHRQRAQWEKKLMRVERQIDKLEGQGVTARRGGGGRVKNDKPLPDVIEIVLRAKGGGPMSVGEVMEGVLAAGYRTNSDHFKGIVNQQLIKDDRFAHTERGVYRLKKEQK